MRSVKSMVRTLFCAAIILGIGYLGIVEGGNQVLRRDSRPEQVKYENVGSNIFYGKIEDDIEIFPWNYYAKESKRLDYGTPEFLTDSWFEEQAGYFIGTASKEMPEDTLTYAADWYFGQLIAYEADVRVEDVMEWCNASGQHIYHNMKVKRDTSYGNIYFYQQMMELDYRKFQVRIACGDWNVISFICTEYDSGEQKEQREWNEGRQFMVTALEQYEDDLADYVTFMTKAEYLSAPSFYADESGERFENAYLQGFRLLDYIMKKKGDQSELAKEMKEQRKIWEEDKMDLAQESGLDYNPHYSYQVVELKDMILLLAQGDITVGIYYDPVNQRFCGYNYFYEY